MGLQDDLSSHAIYVMWFVIHNILGGELAPEWATRELQFFSTSPIS
jgi:hypothetical protein